MNYKIVRFKKVKNSFFLNYIILKRVHKKKKKLKAVALKK